MLVILEAPTVGGEWCPLRTSAYWRHAGLHKPGGLGYGTQSPHGKSFSQGDQSRDN